MARSFQASLIPCWVHALKAEFNWSGRSQQGLLSRSTGDLNCCTKTCFLRLHWAGQFLRCLPGGPEMKMQFGKIKAASSSILYFAISLKPPRWWVAAESESYTWLLHPDTLRLQPPGPFFSWQQQWVKTVTWRLMRYDKCACRNHLKQKKPKQHSVPEEGSVWDGSAIWESLHYKNCLNLGAFHFNQFNFFMRVFLWKSGSTDKTWKDSSSANLLCNRFIISSVI